MFLRFLSESDLKPRSRRTFLAGVRSFASWCMTQEVSVPDTTHLNHWKTFLLLHYETATARTYLAVVKLFFRWIARKGWGSDIGATVKGIKSDKTFRKDCLSAKQIRSVLAYLKKKIPESVLTDAISRKHMPSPKERASLRNYVIVLLLVSCGLRVSEVSLLDCGDLDKVDGRPVIWVHGKGRDGKSDFVRISTELEKLLFQYLKARQTVSQDSPVFISYAPNSIGQRLTARSISRFVKQALVAVGLDSPRLTAHSLRHTAVTLALKGGASLQEVQQFARHRLIETTMRYAHNLEILENPCSHLVTGQLGKTLLK
ncbi:MAG: tyrosine-type recombinase/integrase [Oxalobacter sp.]|nr:tyrosine-type recombinase/integrase [Oxalobacter sp.]